MKTKVKSGTVSGKEEDMYRGAWRASKNNHQGEGSLIGKGIHMQARSDEYNNSIHWSMDIFNDAELFKTKYLLEPQQFQGGQTIRSGKDT